MRHLQENSGIQIPEQEGSDTAFELKGSSSAIGQDYYLLTEPSDTDTEK